MSLVTNSEETPSNDLDSSELEDRNPFQDILDANIPGIDGLEDIFGNLGGGIPGGEIPTGNPFEGEGPFAVGNPFEGDNSVIQIPGDGYLLKDDQGQWYLSGDNVIGEDDQLLFGGGNIFEGESPIGGENPFEGENPFAGGSNPFEGENPFAGGSNPFEGENPFAGGSNPFEGENPFAGGSNPFEGENPFAGGANPFAGGTNPFAGGSSPFG